MRALIIDDDLAIAHIFSRALAVWGWQADEGHSVAEALDLFKRSRYDLVLCDVDLPDGDGVFLARALLKTKPSLLVILTSGRPENIDRAREAGLPWRLHKPFSLDELKALLDSRGIAGGASI